MLFLLRRCMFAIIATLFVINGLFQNVTSNTLPFVADVSVLDTIPNILPEKDKDKIEQESTTKQEKITIVEIAKNFDHDLFVKLERAEAERIHYLVFAVKQNNIHVLEEFLLLVSDPHHRHYAQYKTKEEVAAMTANAHGRQMVLDYLTSIHGVNVVSETANGEYITASATIDVWELLLHSTFHVYHDQAMIGHDHSMRTGKKPSQDRIPTRGELVIRCDQYSLPNSLLEHVSFVFNTVQIPIHHHQRQLPSSIQDLTYKNPTPEPFTTLTSVNDATDSFYSNDNTEPSTLTESNTNIHPYSSSSSSLSSHTTWTTTVTTTATTNTPSAKPSAKPSVRPSSQPTSQPTRKPTNAAITGTLKSTAPHCFVNNTMTPCRLRQIYGITGKGSTPSTIGVFEANNQSFSPADLALFQSNFGLSNQPVAVLVGGSIHGGYQGDSYCRSPAGVGACSESMLDLEYLMGVASGSPTTYWYTSQGSNDLFVDWILAVNAYNAKIPLVLSLSYAEPEASVTISQLQTFNIEAIKLGVQGVTLVVASGDDGVAGFNARSNAANCAYVPFFPASSPYVLTVGATQGLEQTNKYERVCSAATGGLITSGGGFSNVYPRPAYQSAAVASYLTSTIGKSAVAGYNLTGRGYPDVAVAGFNYVTIVGGNVYLLPGTSAGAPVVAGMLALINAKRMAAGYGPVGFVNPALYKLNTTMGFNDVLSGNNHCTAATSSACISCSQGFHATTGWDPVTGFGSLNYTTLLATFMNPINLGTSLPTLSPTTSPSKTPTIKPTIKPTATPTTRTPTVTPSYSPSKIPTGQPSGQPMASPTNQPSRQPSAQPSKPSNQPTSSPSTQPSTHPTRPSNQPTNCPTIQPSRQPTAAPTKPSGQPSSRPSIQPTRQPTSRPSQPSGQPTRQPTRRPSRMPSSQPTKQPVMRPSAQPSRQPTRQPTSQPTRQPTTQPTKQPVTRPSTQPTRRPSSQPSKQPTQMPTIQPSRQPSVQPTSQPVHTPTAQPSHLPSRCPSGQPTFVPSIYPTTYPSNQPSSHPSYPSGQPTEIPTQQPSFQPTSVPSRGMVTTLAASQVVLGVSAADAATPAFQQAFVSSVLSVLPAGTNVTITAITLYYSDGTTSVVTQRRHLQQTTTTGSVGSVTVVGVQISYSIFSHAASVSMASLEATLTNPTSVATMSNVLTQSFPQATVQAPVLLLPTTTPTPSPVTETSIPSFSSTSSPGIPSAPPTSLTLFTHNDVVIVSVVGSFVSLVALIGGVWYHRKQLQNKLDQWNNCWNGPRVLGVGWGNGGPQIHHHHVGDPVSSLVVPVDNGFDFDGGDDRGTNYHNDENSISTNHMNENERRQSRSQYSIQIFASEKDSSEMPDPSSPVHRWTNDRVDDNDNHHVYRYENDVIHDIDDICEEEGVDHVGAMITVPSVGGGPSSSRSSSVYLSNNNTTIVSSLATRSDTFDNHIHTVDTIANAADAATPHKVNDVISGVNNTNDNNIDSTPTSHHHMDDISTPHHIIDHHAIPGGSSNCASAIGSGQGKVEDTTPNTINTLPETPLADSTGEETEEGINIGGIFASLKYF